MFTSVVSQKTIQQILRKSIPFKPVFRDEGEKISTNERNPWTTFHESEK